MSILVQMFLHNRPHFSLSIPICVLQKPQVYLSILLTRNQESSSFILGFGTKSRHSEPLLHSASFFGLVNGLDSFLFPIPSIFGTFGFQTRLLTGSALYTLWFGFQTQFITRMLCIPSSLAFSQRFGFGRVNSRIGYGTVHGTDKLLDLVSVRQRYWY